MGLLFQQVSFQFPAGQHGVVGRDLPGGDRVFGGDRAALHPPPPLALLRPRPTLPPDAAGGRAPDMRVFHPKL